MAVFKCKMCGASLEVADKATTATCDYCGSLQTLPKLSDDKVSKLHERAGHFRRNNEFDKAISVYEQILDEDPTDAELMALAMDATQNDTVKLSALSPMNCMDVFTIFRKSRG